MSKKFKASIIAIGSELSTGKIQDRHGKYAASILSQMGFSVDSIVLVPDNENISTFIEKRKDNMDLMVITGGLGPTSDDITRSVIASAADVNLVINDNILRSLIHKSPGKSTESRKKQAYIPEGFTVLENFCGTAPGFSGYIGSTLVYCLPGPPSEMQDMFERTVIPSIIKKFNLIEPETLNISCFLVCESSLEDACTTYKSRKITWGTRVQEYKITLYLMGGSRDERIEFYEYLKETFGRELIIKGNLTAEEILYNSLKENSSSISIAESVTGGLIAKLITDIPGSSNIFWGSLVAYSNSTKHKLLGVKEETLEDFGAVSREVVLEMASGAKNVSDSDISLAVSGYAGGLNTKNEDTGNIWISVKNGDSPPVAFNFKFSGSRDLIRRKTAVTAMLLAESAMSRPERLDSCDQWQYS